MGTDQTSEQGTESTRQGEGGGDEHGNVGGLTGAETERTEKTTERTEKTTEGGAEPRTTGDDFTTGKPAGKYGGVEGDEVAPGGRNY